MVGFALAIVAGQCIGVELGLERGGGIAAAALLIWLLAAWRASRLEPSSRCLAALLCGAVTAAAAIADPEAPCWSSPEGVVTKRWIEATVIEPVVPETARLRVGVRARLAEPAGEMLCGRLSLSVARPPAAGLRLGDRFRAHVRLRRPSDFANAGAFAYVESLRRRGVWMVGSTAEVSPPEKTVVPFWAARIDRIRGRIRTAILAATAGREAALLRALVLGEAVAIDAATWQTLSASGLVHLVSVSGLHIAAVWGVFATAAAWVLARSERLLLYGDVRAIAALVALAPAVAYAVLAGGSVPAERALAFAVLLVAATALGRETRALRVLAMAAIVIAVARPGAARSISFQLSFAAIAGLVLAADRGRTGAIEHRPRWRRWLAESLLGTLGATLATAPLVAFYFNRLSPIGLLTNPLLVPVLGLPATLLGLLGGAAALISLDAARPFLIVAAWLLGALLEIAEAALHLPLASLRVPTPSILEMALLYGAGLLPWVPDRRRLLVGLVIAACLLGDVGSWWWARSGRDELRVTFVDVGQGDAAIVELPDGRVAVIDGGGLRGSDFDVGERVVARALWARKITRVDVLVASHGDHDHQFGLGFLARTFSPTELWSPATPAELARLGGLRRTASAAGASLRGLAAGDRITDPSGVVFECLHPPRSFQGAANDRSLVLRLRHGRTAWLFPGDVEAVGERLVLAALGGEPVDVLKVPHHGSATSSSAALLAVLRPKVAAISAGPANAYGVPRPEVLRRYRRLATRVFRTDVDGSIIVIGDGTNVRVRTSTPFTRLACSATGALC